MSEVLSIDYIQKIYYKHEYIQEFELRRQKTEELTKEISYQFKVRELAGKGLIKLASGEKVEIKLPPELPGRPWSEILKEIRE